MSNTLRRAPWPVLLLIGSFLCPTELSVYLGSIRLPPHRALLLVLVPFAVLACFGKNRGNIKGYDVALCCFGVWTFAVYLIHHGLADGVQPGGSLALDSFGSYLVARAYVRDAESYRATVAALFVAVAITGILALPEAITSRFYVHELFGALTGQHHAAGVEKRLGLTRAFATFDHPIHLGTFCAAGLAMAAYTARRTSQYVLRLAVIPACAMLGLSSAPMLSLVVQTGLMGLEKATRGIRGRIYLGWAVVLALFFAASIVATRSPFAIIATGFTLDSWTGYYRLLIWEHGLANVWGSPILGIGLNDWVRPHWMVSPTIDAFWLVLAVRGGVPAIVFLAGGLILLSRSIGKRYGRSSRDMRMLATGWQISLAAISLVGCTVHFWNVPYAFFFFVVGLGGWLADPLARSVQRAAKAIPEVPRRRLEWMVAGGPNGESATAPPLPPWAKDPPSWPVPVLTGGPALRRGGVA